MKILITGVSGFLGNKLVKSLKDRYDIIGIIGPSKKDCNFQGINAYYSNDLNQISEEPEVVVMCHAIIPSNNLENRSKDLFMANVEFTEQITNIFPNAYHLYISSVAVYGENDSMLDESSILSPESEYAISKLWGEKKVKLVKKCGILRLSSLYGISMKNNTIIPIYVNQALKNGKIEVWGDGERKQNYIHVTDAMQYIEAMVQYKAEGIYLATSEKETSNIELAEIIRYQTNAQIIFMGFDNSPSKRYNNEITKKSLNIEKQIELSEGIQQYISWKVKQS
jgi:UDP-glucose 4-epimerase